MSKAFLDGDLNRGLTSHLDFFLERSLLFRFDFSDSLLKDLVFIDLFFDDLF